jgi:hypothetical protein
LNVIRVGVANSHHRQCSGKHSELGIKNVFISTRALLDVDRSRRIDSRCSSKCHPIFNIPAFRPRQRMTLIKNVFNLSPLSGRFSQRNWKNLVKLDFSLGASSLSTLFSSLHCLDDLFFQHRKVPSAQSHIEVIDKLSFRCARRITTQNTFPEREKREKNLIKVVTRRTRRVCGRAHAGRSNLQLSKH